MNIDCNRVKDIVRTTRHPRPVTGNGYQKACVFLLVHNLSDPYILFILKADNEGYPWRNQMALPGGHIDSKDGSALDAAFRELFEELSIKRDQVDAIGSVGHFQTINHRDIEVFLGYLKEDRDIRYDPSEIAKVVRIPLDELIRIHKEKKYEGRIPGWEELLYPYEDIVVWGATARMIHYFIGLIKPAVSFV
ncbi:MAG: CoA pyrophosphatase [Proteobacteria bacterium]|nr:CoA pyrophosphatase [Pseudomonadota bacterium]